MKTLLKHDNGRLRTSRVAFLIFLALLLCLSAVYKMGKTADQVFVKVEHVFDAKKTTKKPEKAVAQINRPIEKPIPVQKIETKQDPTLDKDSEKNKTPVKAETIAETIPETKDEPPVQAKVKRPVVTPVPELGATTVASLDAANDTAAGSGPLIKKVQAASPSSKSEPDKAPASGHNQVVVEKVLLPPKSVPEDDLSESSLPQKKMEPSVDRDPAGHDLASSDSATQDATVEKKAVVPSMKPKPVKAERIQFTLAKDLERIQNPKGLKKEKPNALKLSSKDYFEIYRQWQDQGEKIDTKNARVGLQIHNLENVYDLFQMKAVVMKHGIPHMDLEDSSRVAQAALSEFSSTCFIVSNPWEKWGTALKNSGFSKTDKIEIRYYTYEFVRNSIYARALKAFEWGLAKKNLPKDTDPSRADVLGVVYEVNKDKGGSFGVFVPTRVDFKSRGFVQIDPLVCFKGQKDIDALNRAGLL